MKISVIIPTLNEEKYLPNILEDLKKQDVNIHEIIVADGFSIDRTREIAKETGCKVVDGPTHPGVGRNRGGAVASGDILFFFDADVKIPDGFMKRFLDDFYRRELDCATSLYIPIENKFLYHFFYFWASFLMLIFQFKKPLAAGFFIVVKKELFDVLEGFNENMPIDEDHDFVQRAGRVGKFRIIYKILKVSMRRYEKGSKIKLAARYFVLCFKMLFNIKESDNNAKVLDYEFGEYD